MPVPVKVLGLVVVATVLVVAMLQEVEPEIITVLAVALASLAPAVFTRTGDRRPGDRRPGRDKDHRGDG